MSKPKFQIINASAGSGKTFSLVLHYLEILLAAEVPSPTKNLLALTFTNKAVNEIKARILGHLNTLATFPDKEKIILNELIKRLELSTAQIKDRSGRVLRKILQEYASFDILTLDKFTHRVIRTFAKDFKLPFGFEVAVDSKSMLTEMVSSIIDQVGQDAEITKVLYAYSKSKMEKNLSWDIKMNLLSFADLLLQENDREPIDHLKTKTTKRLYEDRIFLEATSKVLQTDSVRLATEVLQLIESVGLEKEDFFKKVLYNHFEKIKNLQLEGLYNNQLGLALEGEKPLYTKKLDASKQERIESIREQLKAYYFELKSKVCLTLFTESILKNWTPLSLLHTMEKNLDDLQNDQQRMLLAQFNTKIAALIADQPAPFIYERLGERYRHYFIDEFQDTSELQWNNLIPLIGNALETEEVAGQAGSLLLVGDPKQAIYRWRGGNISQFLTLLNEQNPFQVDLNIDVLPKNFRSKDNIVQFNNRFFTIAGNFLNDTSSSELFANQSQQEPNGKVGGYVHLDFIPGKTKSEEAKDLYLTKTIDAIRMAQENGFHNKEITILVRKKKQAAIIGAGLSREGIPVLSSESLLLNQSDTIGFLIALFRLTYLTNDLQQHKIILDYLWKYIIEESEDYHRFISQHLRRTTSELFFHLKIVFDFKKFKQQPVYNALEMALSDFAFIEKNDSYIVYFMENVFEFSNTKNATFKSYMNYWDLNSDNFHVAMPDGLDAIQIMTIHKAKGLEFPVVILPFLDESFQPGVNSKIWIPLHEEPLDRLDWVWVNSSKKLLDLGDDIAEHYQQEVLKNELDAYTVLYVAMTRAEEQMYIITKHCENEARNYAYLFQLLAMEERLEYHEDTPVEWGEKKRLDDSLLYQSPKNESLYLALETSIDWQNRLISQFDNAIEFSRNQREWGILIHQMLKTIRHVDMLELALQQALETGKIELQERPVFKNLLERVIFHPQLYPYFNTEGRVFNEHDILIPNGETFRPDRVVLQDDEVILIDYKTGKPKPEDKIQLEQYADLIKGMGFKTVTKFLVYIKDEISVVCF